MKKHLQFTLGFAAVKSKESKNKNSNRLIDKGKYITKIKNQQKKTKTKSKYYIQHKEHKA